MRGRSRPAMAASAGRAASWSHYRGVLTVAMAHDHAGREPSPKYLPRRVRCARISSARAGSVLRPRQDGDREGLAYGVRSATARRGLYLPLARVALPLRTDG